MPIVPSRLGWPPAALVTSHRNADGSLWPAVQFRGDGQATPVNDTDGAGNERKRKSRFQRGAVRRLEAGFETARQLRRSGRLYAGTGGIAALAFSDALVVFWRQAGSASRAYPGCRAGCRGGTSA